MTIITAGVINGFLNALSDIYETLDVAKSKPIKSYVQVLKIVLYAVTGVLAISSLLGESPLVLLGGIGALSAVLLLIFKDSILGLVASIQLSTNDMVRNGDWIEVPAYGADGDVIDIALTTIRVQNFDKTISTVPSYALISGSFRNWRGMSDSGGRRIKRSIYLTTDSVKFLEPADVKRFEGMALIGDHVRSKSEELSDYNIESGADLKEMVNGRRLTNLGTFRAYVLAYLKDHPDIHHGMTLLVRQLSPGDTGVGIELYCFTTDTDWVKYEDVQADIFDHLLAAVPEFGLRVFQQPTGGDFRAALTPGKS